MEQRSQQKVPKWFYLLSPFLVLAGTGFVLTLLANLAVLLGLHLPSRLPVNFLLPGIFIVWLPTVFVASQVTRSVSQKELWKVLLSGAPSWMRMSLYGVVAYGALNFLLLFVRPGTQAHQDTPEAFIRFASGHCLIFYGVAFVTLYSVINTPQLLAKHTCFNGHVVSPVASFCSTCGQPVMSDETIPSSNG